MQTEHTRPDHKRLERQERQEQKQEKKKTLTPDAVSHIHMLSIVTVVMF